MNTELPSDELNKINPVQTQFKWNCVHALSAFWAHSLPQLRSQQNVENGRKISHFLMDGSSIVLQLPMLRWDTCDAFISSEKEIHVMHLFKVKKWLSCRYSKPNPHFTDFTFTFGQKIEGWLIHLCLQNVTSYNHAKCDITRRVWPHCYRQRRHHSNFVL